MFSTTIIYEVIMSSSCSTGLLNTLQFYEKRVMFLIAICVCEKTDSPVNFLFFFFLGGGENLHTSIQLDNQK